MKEPQGSRVGSILAFMVVCLMFQGAGWTGSATEHQFLARAGRGGDIEPDNWTPSSIANGELIEGSLMMSSPDDTSDIYKVEGRLETCKLLCVTLYMVDYDINDPGRFNFILYVDPAGGTVSENRTETVTYFNFDQAITSIYIYIIANYSENTTNITTEPGRYHLRVSMDDPPLYPGGLATGRLSQDNGPSMMVYRLAGPANDSVTRFKLQSPADCIFYLDVFTIWPFNDKWWCQNYSHRDASGGYQEVSIVGIGGPYYIFINLVAGFGSYTLTAQFSGNPVDDDNSPSKATLIDDNQYHFGSVASGVDSMDWYKVNVKADVPLEYASVALMDDQFTGTFNVALYDSQLRLLSSTKLGTDRHFVDYGCLTVSHTGPLYFLVSAGEFGKAAIGGWGGYSLLFRLPNEPPRIGSSIPIITMDEDSSYNGFVIPEYIIDPDGDNMSYSLLGSNYSSMPKVDKDTGRVNFTPKPHWSGQETVRFQVLDDGPGQAMIRFNVTVKVRPVNDMPAVLSFIPDAGMKEEAQWQTPDLATIFSDEDDLPSNLSFGCRVICSDTHPPGAWLPIRQDLGGGSFAIGPVRLAYGTFTIELNCTDNRPGTVAASTRFNLTVGHVNHDPGLGANVDDPLGVTIREHDANLTIGLDELFTDLDLPDEYAGDRLTYSVTGMKRLGASLDAGKRKLLLDASMVEYKPGFREWETIVVTAKDMAGRTATLNISITVEPVNDPPAITAFGPEEELTSVKEGQRKAFSVTAADMDTDDHDMTYTWFLDDILKARGKNDSFAFEPDYSMGGVAHWIRVDVSDGNTTLSKEWQVLVADVNRLPEGSIRSPASLAKFMKGAAVAFAARGSDPDGDNLTFIWRDLAGNEWGRGANFTTKRLPKGSQTIRLEMNDTKGSTFVDVTIRIEEQAQKKSPGFGAVPFLAALCLAAALGVFWRRKGHDRPPGR